MGTGTVVVVVAVVVLVGGEGRQITQSSFLIFTSFFKIRFSTVLSQWDFSHGKFGLLSRGKPAATESRVPNLLCMLGVLVFPESTKL